MPEPVIRLAELPDAPAVAALIRSLESHYAADGRCSALDDVLAMVEASMRSREGTRYAVAFVEGRPVGLACFALLRPGRRLRGLAHLKELFVERDIRGRAVGAALVRWLAAYARAHGIGRIDLITDGGNAGAQAFYERLGADRLEKVVRRFDLSAGAPCDFDQETA